MAGIYLHIPFCNSKCIYCGFYSVTARIFREKFIPALKREISGRGNFFSSLYSSDQTIRTLYIGGGTPSVLDISQLEEAVCCLKNNFAFSSGAFYTDNPDEFEFTVEVNPDDITPEYASALKRLGANRISMGVQSFSDSHLSWMGRRHTSAQAVEAFFILRQAGFSNISLDLIFGFPALSAPQWEENLERVLLLRPEHISAYQLGIDADTPLEQQASRGRFSLPEEAVCAQMYSVLQQKMKDGGYEQYEVSNFAFGSAQEHRSRHNCSYWERVPYLGLGPGAHSFIARHREWNYCAIESYLDANTLSLREGENLSPQDVFNETLMLGLRTVRGVSLKTLRESDPMAPAFVRDMLPALSSLCGRNLLTLGKDGYIKIPPGKLFVSDGIIRDLFVGS